MGDPKWRGYGMVVGATICWGTMGVVAKLLFRDQGVDPLVLVVVRAYLATFTLFAVLGAIAPGQLRIDARMFRAAAIVGVGGLLTNNFLYFEAIHLTSVATALLLQYQAPVLVALYELLIHRQRVTRRLWLSLALSMLGCALVVRVYDPALLRLNLLGVLAGLGTALGFAFYILTSRAALRSMGPLTLVAYGYLAASLVVAATAAYVILGETLLPLQVLGGGLVLAGVVMVETA